MLLFFVLLLFFVFNSHVYVLSTSYTLTECKKEQWVEEVLAWECRAEWGESWSSEFLLSLRRYSEMSRLLLYHSSCIIYFFSCIQLLKLLFNGW